MKNVGPLKKIILFSLFTILPVFAHAGGGSPGGDFGHAKANLAAISADLSKQIKNSSLNLAPILVSTPRLATRPLIEKDQVTKLWIANIIANVRPNFVKKNSDGRFLFWGQDADGIYIEALENFYISFGDLTVEKWNTERLIEVRLRLLKEVSHTWGYDDEQGTAFGKAVLAKIYSNTADQRISKTGAVFTRDNTIHALGDAWREPDQPNGNPGIIWGEIIKGADQRPLVLNYSDASAECAKRGGRIPHKKEYDRLAQYFGNGTLDGYSAYAFNSKIQMIPGLVKTPTWGEDPYDLPTYFFFDGATGKTSGSDYVYQNPTRCVSGYYSPRLELPRHQLEIMKTVIMDKIVEASNSFAGDWREKIYNDSGCGKIEERPKQFEVIKNMLNASELLTKAPSNSDFNTYEFTRIYMQGDKRMRDIVTVQMYSETSGNIDSVFSETQVERDILVQGVLTKDFVREENHSEVQCHFSGGVDNGSA